MRIKPYLILSLLCCALYLPGIQVMPIMDRDSAHFAQATRQMLQTKQYFQIRFQEKTRYQKPPGINWLQAAAVKLFSDPNSSLVWPYRLPSFLGGLLSVLLLFGFSRTWIGEKTALLAASLLAVTLLLTVESHLAVIDSSLLSAVIMMQGALWKIYMEYRQNDKATQAHWGWALVFWLAMAYGFLLKGVTPLVGFLTLISLSLADKNWRWLKGLHLGWGIPLFFLSMVWLLFVNEAEQSNYLLKMVQKDLLPKLKGGHESHGQPPLFHLAILPLTFWPASLFLWQAGVRGWQNRGAFCERFLLAWIVPTWIFFEIMPTKLPQYVLPVFPALAVLAALAIKHWQTMKLTKRHLRWLRFLIACWGLFSILFGVFFSALSFVVLKSVSIVSIFASLFMILSALVSVGFSWKMQYRAAACTVIIGAVFAYSAIYQGVLPGLKPVWLSNRVIEAIGPHRLTSITEDKPLLVLGYEEPSLVFNLNTSRVKFTGAVEVIDVLRDEKTGSRLVLVDESRYQLLQSMAEKAGFLLCPVARIGGINYNKGKQVSLRLLEYRESHEC